MIVWLFDKTSSRERECVIEMANVFGNPITDSTLKGMAEYANKEITAADRARVAINMKDTNARTLENLKKECGTEERKTFVFIYNATGNPMTFAGSREWHGLPTPSYSSEIQNGQWALFRNVKDSFGSVAGVVYRSKNGNSGEDSDHMMAWSNPWPGKGKNSVWSETREVDHFTDLEWAKIRKYLIVPRSEHSDTWKGCRSYITITDNTSGKVATILSTIPEAPHNA